MEQNLPVKTTQSSVPQRPVVEGVWNAPNHAAIKPDGHGEAKLGFEEIWVALRRGVKLILLVTLLVTALTIGYTLLLPTEYEAISIVSVITSEGGRASAGQSAIDAVSVPFGRHSLPNELGRLQHSQDLSRRVAARLIEADSVLNSRAFFPILEAPDGEADLGVQDVADLLFDQVTFQSLREQDMIEIIAVSTVPEEAARIANMYAEEYRKVTLEESRASVVAARTFLEEQVGNLSGELDEIDDQVVAFSQSRRIPERGYAGEQLVQQYASFRAQQDQTRLQIESQRHALNVITEELDRVSPEEGYTRPRTQGLEAEISSFDQRIADLKLRTEPYYTVNPDLYGNESEVPELQELIGQIQRYEQRREGLTSQLAALTEGLPTAYDEAYVAQLRTQRAERQALLGGLEAQSRSLGSRVGGFAGQLQGIPRQTVELAQLERRKAVVGSFYNTFLVELQRTLIAEESELGYVSVVSAASTPRSPFRPNMPQNVILGLLLGLGFGVGLALVRHATDRQLRRPEDLQMKGYRVLGVVPSMDKQIKAMFNGSDEVEVEGKTISSLLMARIDPWSPITENFRLIRTNLSHTFPAPPKVLLITSPELGAGKTVTSTNLAVAMAVGGQKTLLIDADMRRPGGHILLGEENQITLANLLLDGDVPHANNGTPQSVEDLFSQFGTDVDNLSFIPAGDAKSPPSELIDTERFTSLIESARQVFDAILIDSPPVLVATDALLLAEAADASLMVVSANQTDLKALEQARSALEGVGLPLAGIVVNRFDDSKGSGYAYGYSPEYVQAYKSSI